MFKVAFLNASQDYVVFDTLHEAKTAALLNRARASGVSNEGSHVIQVDTMVYIVEPFDPVAELTGQDLTHHVTNILTSIGGKDVGLNKSPYVYKIHPDDKEEFSRALNQVIASNYLILMQDINGFPESVARKFLQVKGLVRVVDGVPTEAIAEDSDGDSEFKAIIGEV